MPVRIFSPVVYRSIKMVVATASTFLCCEGVSAQSNSGYLTDPATGIVYQQVTRTVERPVVETKYESREQTVFRPQTVTETKPHTRTVLTPVIEYKWEARVKNRWNPFKRPTVAYHHVPNAHWEQHQDVVHRTTTRTEWVAEKRTVDIPQRIVRLQREQKVDFEPVGRVAPQAAPGPTDALASRLRPLGAGQQLVPTGQSGGTNVAMSNFSSPRIASSTVAGSSSGRSHGQGGMPTTTLSPSVPIIPGQPLPPITTTAPSSLPFFR